MRNCVEDNKFIENKIVRSTITELNVLARGSVNSTVYPVKLSKPFQRGWIGTYQIREDVLRSKWGESLVHALSVVNVTGRHYSPDFVSYPTKKQIKRGAIIFDAKPKLNKISTKKWESLPPLVRRWFCKETPLISYFGLSRLDEIYTLTPHYGIVFKSRPYMITHVMEVDTVKATKEKQLENLIERRRYWSKYCKLRKGSQGNRGKSKYFKRLELEKIINKEVKVERNEYC